MLIQNILKYTFIQIINFLVVFVTNSVYCQTATDTTKSDTTQEKTIRKDFGGKQICFSADIFHPVYNYLYANQSAYEFTLDYYLHKDLYMIAEGGWGSSNVDYSDLKYKTNNSFFRFGLNRSLLIKNDSNDWDMMCIGIRLAMANIKRSAASYTVIDSLWGSSPGNLPDKSFIATWLELDMGTRVQLVNCLSAGWTIRAKFLLNGKSFSDLAPSFIAGYGRGDKNAVFDVNFYISYAIRWRKEIKKEGK